MNKKLFEDGKNCAIDDIYLNLNNLVVKWGIFFLFFNYLNINFIFLIFKNKGKTFEDEI